MALNSQDRKILEVTHVAKSFGRNSVLKDVTFEIRSSEIVGIVGENGSGKSTLLKIIMGLLAPNAGKVMVQGSIGYCPQELQIFETLTVSENFYYFAEAYSQHQTTGDEKWKEVKDSLLARFRFQQYKNTLAALLSEGTKRKLNLSIALLHSPDIFILDEPYSGFDWETYLHFWEYTKELRSQGKGILIVSHLVYDSSKVDRLFELTGGVLKCD